MTFHTYRGVAYTVCNGELYLQGVLINRRLSTPHRAARIHIEHQIREIWPGDLWRGCLVESVGPLTLTIREGFTGFNWISPDIEAPCQDRQLEIHGGSSVTVPRLEYQLEQYRRILYCDDGNFYIVRSWV